MDLWLYPRRRLEGAGYPGPEPLIVEDGPTACIESSPGACDVTKKQATACTYSACRPNFMAVAVLAEPSYY